MTDFNISVPPQVQAVVERLNDRGFSAYAVGGCVRDSLLGTEPKDWDITTSATACETKKMLFPIMRLLKRELSTERFRL